MGRCWNYLGEVDIDEAQALGMFNTLRAKIARVSLPILILMCAEILLASSATGDNSVNTGFARPYLTPEERRNAGQAHQLTDWLSIAGLIEGEYVGQWSKLSQSLRRSFSDDNSQTLQIAADLTLWPWLKGELVYNLDMHGDFQNKVDEAFISLEKDKFSLDFGKVYLPFGEYFSHFISGPIIELGETRTNGGVVTYQDDRLEISGFLYDGLTNTIDGNSNELDFGFSQKFGPFDRISIGAGFISNLTNSSEPLLKNSNNHHQSRVSGLSGFAAIDATPWNFSCEFLKALGSYAQFERNQNSPQAWNIEIAYTLNAKLDLAVRIEGSSDFPDSAHRRIGTGLSYRVIESVTWSTEVLYGEYSDGFAEDRDQREISSQTELVTQLSFEF